MKSPDGRNSSSIFDLLALNRVPRDDDVSDDDVSD
eukprot:CAMPEP_0198202326 /NCGR_PEP_ID=MMETSP1445-20131203/5462_1 /TAXON_ID=36898 /ORGANISM="Pyramimonas sp., Strain CCMP2087" /LENGTH=34 /DNA_ID= /DNA_START= /DNA_END= /DNA_ORIENTATION=